MATIIVIDDKGQVRMERNTNNTIVGPPPNWTPNQWSAYLVKALLDQLDGEAAKHDDST